MAPGGLRGGPALADVKVPEDAVGPLATLGRPADHPPAALPGGAPPPPEASSGRSPARTRVVFATTVVRIVLASVVLALVLTGAPAAAAVVFAVAAATDYLDGYLARRWGVSTAAGSFLDTTADKVLVTGALIALVSVGRVWPWAAFVIIGRELAVMGLRSSAAMRGTLMVASPTGRLKTAIQFVAILVAILGWNHPVGPLGLDQWVMLAAVAITVASAVEYLARFSWTAKPRGRIAP